MHQFTRWITVSIMFLMAAASAAAQYEVIYNFGSLANDGIRPSAPLVIGEGRVLYGTTEYGGNAGSGTVFSLTPPASPGGPWTEQVLYSFSGGSDGGVAYASLVIGNGGVLYGATGYGGTGSCNYDGLKGCGVVFSLTPPISPGGTWTEAVLYDFTGGYDGAFPNAVVLDNGGVLYGTTAGGGNACPLVVFPGCGTVFSLTPPAAPGGPWALKVLDEFNNGSGPANPIGGLLISGGVVYGTTFSGGAESCLGTCGTVFSLTPPTAQDGLWSEEVLYNFPSDLADGANPTGAVVMANGVLYGTTLNGGSGACSATGLGGCGVVFSLSPRSASSGAWTETVLHSFNTKGHCSNGAVVNGGVAIGRNGTLYGTTNCSRPNEGGGVYSLTPPTSPGGPWDETTLHDFMNVANGATPYATVAIGEDGVLYGTTYYGGTYGSGVVFALKP